MTPRRHQPPPDDPEERAGGAIAVEGATHFWRRVSALLVGGCVAATLSGGQTSARQTPPAPASATSSPRDVIKKYCITCHNQRLRTAGLELESLSLTTPGLNAEVWEKVIA